MSGVSQPPEPTLPVPGLRRRPVSETPEQALMRALGRLLGEVGGIRSRTQAIERLGTSLTGTQFPAAQLAGEVATLARVVEDLITALEDAGLALNE